MSPVWNGDYRSGGNTFPILLGMPTSIKGENQSNCSKTNHGTTDNVTSTTRSLSEDGQLRMTDFSEQLLTCKTTENE
ncbi:hypothetical protein Smp_081700 [Schistosoma mansoni]|uniref:hypothetical protein n=1 Tax=Schistosoma mansoni TaxID=6183 RepID=UPI00022DC643|nr:hypothetical protein Smp_081700 [Schistosoma mansoni]|eukprot:XP_018652185.1 hypothetical protein Smp_081700 [Schistosoma mansoni]